MTVPQAYLHASAEAAAAALVALHERRRSGKGQHIDVSAQQAAAMITLGANLGPALNAPGLFSLPSEMPRDRESADGSGHGPTTAFEMDPGIRRSERDR